jgi:hypothetical protein
MFDAYINVVKEHPVLAAGVVIFFIVVFIVTEIPRRMEKKRKAQEAAGRSEAKAEN